MVKNLPANVGDVDSIPGSGRSPGEGNGNPLQYSCLENPMDRGAWRETVPGVRETDMTQQLNNNFVLYGNTLVLSGPLFDVKDKVLISLETSLHRTISSGRS